MANDETIYILDQITPKAGRGKAFLQSYMDGYAPVARARGLKLEYTWVSPPMWMEGEQSNTLFIVWSVKGVAAYWAVESKARRDPTSSHWWRDAEPMIATRSRSVLSDASNIASLTNV
jgi:hypothetical protein